MRRGAGACCGVVEEEEEEEGLEDGDGVVGVVVGIVAVVMAWSWWLLLVGFGLAGLLLGRVVRMDAFAGRGLSLLGISRGE